MIKRNFSVFVCLSILIGLLSDSAFAYSLEEIFKKKIDFQAGGSISLENTNGKIEVQGWSEPYVLIEAEKKVSASGKKRAQEYMDQIEIDIYQSEKDIEIRTHLPGRGKGGGFFDWIFGDHYSASVNYKISVPHSSNLELSSTNGAINVSEVEGTIRIETTNGAIRADEIAGKVDAYTTNGSIKVDFDRLAENDEMDFNTTNGSITVYLPSDVACSVWARTTNGSIKTDFPLEVSGKFNSKKLRGEINGGGSSLNFKTTNGSIRIAEK
ncbi:MAG: hypothetical protein Kow0042_09640 [Calditrichia bacterium]